MLKIFVVVLLLSTYVTANNPGVLVKVTQPGIDLAIDIATTWVTSWIKNYDIKSFGDDLKFKEVKLISMSLGNPDVKTKPGTEATVSIKSASAKVSGKFVYKQTFFFIPITFDGKFDVKANGVSGDLTATLGLDSKKRPTLSSKSCAVKIGDIDVTVEDTGADLVANLVIGLFKGTAKKWLENQICPVLKNTVNKRAKILTEQYPKSLKIPYTNVSVDISLLYTPIFDVLNRFSVALSGRVFPNKNPDASYDFSPAFSKVDGSSRMAYAAITDYTMNTLLASLVGNGQFRGVWSAKKLPIKLPFNLNAQYLTKFVSGLDNYTDRAVSIAYGALGAPQIAITPAAVNITGGVQFAFNLLPSSEGEETFVAFILDLKFQLVGHIFINGSKIAGNLTNAEFLFTQNVTNVGEVPVNLLTLVTNALVKRTIGPVNGFLGKGINIPTYRQFSSKNGEISLHQGYFVVGSDIIYNKATTTK